MDGVFALWMYHGFNFALRVDWVSSSSNGIYLNGNLSTITMGCGHGTFAPNTLVVDNIANRIRADCTQKAAYLVTSGGNATRALTHP